MSSTAPDHGGRPAGSEQSITATQELDSMGRAPDGVRGYSPRQVEEFVRACEESLRAVEAGGEPRVASADVRGKAFEAEEGGYDVADVDSMLDSYEDRLARAECARFAAEHGRPALQARAEELAGLVMGRLHRREGERFRRPAGKRALGYFAGDVDRLCEELLAYFAAAERLSPRPLRDAAFRTASGRTAYDEAQVDAFMARVGELIQTLRWSDAYSAEDR
jgi:DivIVA domain-containing protein